MDVYVGDGDVVKMKCSATGDVKNPNMHEWVLKDDIEDVKSSLRVVLSLLTDPSVSSNSARMGAMGASRVNDAVEIIKSAINT